MLINNSRGSEWRKCDLHMHSTASDGTATPQELVDEAVRRGLDIIALTDHHTVNNIDEIKACGKAKDLTVISGIEFRTEYGQKSVHMIGLFPDYYDEIELSQKALYELVLSPLDLTDTKIKQAGHKIKPDCNDDVAFKEGIFQVQVDFRAAADLIHKYGGIVTVHAGAKSNSLDEEMKHEGPAKKNVDVADSLGPVKEELLRDYIDICEVRNGKEVEFYIKTWNKPCIAASDTHDVSEVARNYCWIKCAPSFEGVKQIIYEPESRVRIQSDKPEVKTDYQVIDRVEINHGDFGTQIIPFNQGLNTIIGGRSSGKSVLLGCLARLCGDNTSIKPNKPEYDNYISRIQRSMKLYWRDLGEKTNRKIDFFPQSYIIDMASDPQKIKNLVENIQRDENGENEELAILKGKLETITVLQHTLFSDYRKKSATLETLQSDAKEIGDRDGIQQEVKKLEASILKIKMEAQSGLSDEESALYNQQKEQITELKRKEKEYKDLATDISGLKEIPIFAEMEFSLSSLQDEELSQRLSEAYDKLKSETLDKWLNILNGFCEEYRAKLEENQNNISAIESEPFYINATKAYEENTRLVEENEKLAREKDKLAKIDRLSARINQTRNELLGILEKIIANYQELYNSQCDYCSSHIINKGDVTITPQVVFQSKQYQENIAKYFDARSAKNNDILCFKYTDQEKFSSFTKKLLNGLVQDEYVLKSGNSHMEAAESFFSNNPFMIEYNINYQGDDLAEMSEGKTAFVILRLLLDFSKNEYPILIDQPEDDLDNRAIYGDLVSYLRDKKITRQIILVTHNPNIVVGADAEEIIVANQHGLGNKNPENVKFVYLAGALEDSFKGNSELVLLKQGIREHVCDLLEGGDEAFQLREQKYQLV